MCYQIGHNCIISINNYYLLIEISLLRETIKTFRLSVNRSKLFYCMATIKYSRALGLNVLTLLSLGQYIKASV